MKPQANRNGVAAIRVSTTKQGRDGDSPEAQKEQIERFALNKGIVIKKFFVFMESASKEQQPMQEAIDYCKNKKNNVDLFIIKSIDRFTRGGSLSYDLLKTQLDSCGITLVDTYGVISQEQVNTLEHLGHSYKWSTYSPSRKSEMLEAERSKDEVRDILSRVIGAEIRYTQMGYYMRRPPYGYVSEKVETQHGKRPILKSHPEESKYITKLFELRASRQFTDKEIATKLNDMGYRGRTQYRRSKTDRSRIIGKTEGALLNDKKVWRIGRNPIYAGIIVEKWTKHQPVKAMFEGIVSVELFNRANRGKRTIIEMPGNKIAITDNMAARNATPQGTRNNDFAFKHYVMCPQCNKPLSGSTSRGKTGKYYSYYHCDKRGHKFRVSKEDLETKIYSFIDGMTFSQERIDKVFAIVRKKYEQHIATHEAQTTALNGQITTLEAKARELTRSFATIAPSAQKYVNEELEGIDIQIKRLALERTNMESKKPMDIDTVLERIRKFSENIGQAIAQQGSIVKKAQLFGLLFKTLPTYNDLRFRNQKTPLFTGVHPVFQLLAGDNLHLVTLIEANWNLICEEILRWVEIIRGGQWSLPLPAKLGTM
jgi:hypothetical protein